MRSARPAAIATAPPAPPDPAPPALVADTVAPGGMDAPATTPNATSTKRPGGSTGGGRTPSSKKKRKELTEELHRHNCLSRILAVTVGPEEKASGLTPRHRSPRHNEPRMVLVGLDATRLNAGNASEVLFARLAQGAASGSSNAALMTYLLKAYCRSALRALCARV